jgi:hypothetical protein
LLTDIEVNTAHLVDLEYLFGELGANFDGLDANFDGLLTFGELRAGLSPLATDDKIQLLINAVDMNSDGQISKLEEIIGAGSSDATRIALALSALNKDSLTFAQAKDALSPLWPGGTIDAVLRGIDSDGNGMISMQEITNSKLSGVAQGILGLLQNGGITAQQASTALVSAGAPTNTVVSTTPTGTNSTSTSGTGSGSTSTSGSAGGFYLVTPYGSVFTSSAVSLINGWSGTPAQAKSITSDYFGQVPPSTFRSTMISLGVSAPALDFLYGWPSSTAASWAAQNGLPAFESGGLHAGGLRLVGERGPELEVTGPARYWSADQTRQMMAGQDNTALLSELRALRAEVANLRAETRSTATSSAKTARILDAVTTGGESIKTEAFAL